LFYSIFVDTGCEDLTTATGFAFKQFPLFQISDFQSWLLGRNLSFQFKNFDNFQKLWFDLPKFKSENIPRRDTTVKA
jgi:hypothetical protein